MKRLLIILLVLSFMIWQTPAFAAREDALRDRNQVPTLLGDDDGETRRIKASASGDLLVNATTSMTLVRKESSQALGSGALAYTTNFSEKTRIKQILFHAASNITQTVTFTLDSKTNSTYDTILASEDLVAEANYSYLPFQLILEDGDELLIACTNSGTPAITVYVTVIGETIS